MKLHKLCLLVFWLISAVVHVYSQASEDTPSKHDEGKPYAFAYAVKDEIGNDFGHNVESDGNVVKGEYRTLLPDGRIQTVKYQADWKNGYTATITYSVGPNQVKMNTPTVTAHHAFATISGDPIQGKMKTPTVTAHHAFGAPGKLPCAGGTVGLDCNPVTSFDDAKPQGDS